MVYELEIFLVGFFFLIFLIQIIFLGFIFIFKINKKSLDLPILELILFSIVIGIPLYIFYAYLIETFLIFNFFTINLPIMIIDIIGFSYIYKKSPCIKTKLKVGYIRNYLRTNKKNIIYYLLIFIIVFFCQFLQETSILSLSESLLYKDPYYWCEMEMYLIDYGHLNYERIQAYGAGMVFLNGGSLLFYPQYRFIFIFHKFIPIFHLSLLIFIIFVFSKRFFKNKVVIFFCMIGFLLLRYFNYRFLISIPAALGTVFAFLIFIFFIETSIPKSLIGFIFAGTFLFHPLYGLFIIIIYFFYFISQLISILIKSINKKKILISFLRSHVKLLLIFLTLLLPFMLNLILKYKVDWIFNYLRYFLPTELFSQITINTNLIFINPVNPLNNFFNLASPLQFSLSDNIIYFSYATFGVDKIIYIITLFFIIVPSSSNRKSLILIKIWFAFTFIFFLSYDLLVALFPKKIELQTLIFFSTYKMKIFEFSAGIIILIIGFVLEEFLIFFKKITNYLIKRFSKYRKIILGNVSEVKKIIKNMKHSTIRKIFRIEFPFIIIIITLSYLRYSNIYIDYNYLHKNSLVDVVLTMSEITTPYSNETIIIPDYVNHKPISYLLYRFNTIETDFSQSYDVNVNLFFSHNASYFLICLKNVNIDDLEKYILNFDIFYQNPDYLILGKN